jgi:Xaa-Pro aminopeptidase
MGASGSDQPASGKSQLGSLIPREEFVKRQAAVAEAARQRGLDGVVCWSKCGGTYDAYSDAVYLANHYTVFPHLRDYHPHWAAHSHIAIVIPVDDDPLLVVDLEHRADLLAVADVRCKPDVEQALVDGLRDRGLERARLGLSGTEYFALSSHRRIAAMLPRLTLVPVDDLMDDIRVIKSQAELEMLRASGRVSGEAFDAMMAAVAPGDTEADAVAAAVDVITRSGGALYSALVSSGPDNEFAVSNPLPGYDASRTLKDGELFHVDMYGPVYGGYLFDYSRSTVVGGHASDAQKDLLELSVKAVDTVVKTIKPGVTAEELAITGDQFLAENGDADANLDIFSGWGHGLGLGWEPPWLIRGDTTKIAPGMCIAVERFVSEPGVGTVCFEQNVIVHEAGPEIISSGQIRWW